MLIAISGSQGTGKGTVISGLNKLGYPTIKRKTSRSILDDWGVTLSAVNNSRELTTRFQDEITKRKYQDEKAAIDDKTQLWFTERTHADLFAYALISIGKDNEYNEWVNRYYETCKHYTSFYSHVVYIQSGLFQIKKDGVRGINTHYGRMVDVVMRDLTEEFIPSNKLTIITIQGKQERISMIADLAKLVLQENTENTQ